MCHNILYCYVAPLQAEESAKFRAEAEAKARAETERLARLEIEKERQAAKLLDAKTAKNNLSTLSGKEYIAPILGCSSEIMQSLLITNL